TCSSSGTAVDCTGARRVSIGKFTTANITIPSPNTRSDCSNNLCTAAAERANIMNWYRYYLTRMAATQTAMGLALQDERLDNSLRIGYLRSNFPDDAIKLQPGKNIDSPGVL